MIRKGLAGLLCLSLLLAPAAVPGSLHPLAAPEEQDLAEGESYLVPMEFYTAGANTDWSHPKLKKMGLFSTVRTQVYDLAEIRRLGGKYEVSLYYHGFHVSDMVQLMDIEGAKRAEKDGYTYCDAVPMGSFNKPAQYKDPGAEGLEKSVSAAGDRYCRTDARTVLFDEERDTGKITLTLEELSGGLYFRSLYTPNSGLPVSQYISFDLSKAERIASYGAGQYTLGYDWCNYVAAIKRDDFSRKYTDQSVKMYERISKLFERAVETEADGAGRLRASLRLRDTEGIESISLAGKKGLDFGDSNKARKRLEQEFEGTDFTELWKKGSGKDTITLDFKDIRDGRYLQILTEEDSAYNSKKKPNSVLRRGWYAYLRLTPKVKEESEEERLLSGEAELRMAKGVIPENSEFRFERVEGAVKPLYCSEYDLKGAARFSRSGSACVSYNSSLKANGEQFSLNGQVTLRLKLPEDFDLSTTTVQISKSSGEFENTYSKYIDRDSRTFVFTTSQAADLNATYSFYDYGQHLRPEELAEFPAGLYRVRLTMAHASLPYFPSMSNQSIVDNTGYLEVSEAEGKKSFRVYYALEPVYVSGITGYMTGEFCCDGEDQSVYTPVEVHSYYTAEDGGLGFDAWAREYHFQYLKSLSFPLGKPRDDGSYLIRFTVPAMDVHTGDGTGVQVASLRISEPEKLEDGAVNPLAGHDKSVLRAVIERAERALESMDKAGEAYRSLQSAVSEAKQCYSGNPSEEELLKGRDKLLQAMKDSGAGEGKRLSDGVYRLPFTVYENGGEAPSSLSGYFGRTLILTAAGSTMKLKLPLSELDGDSVTELQYDNGVMLKDAEKLKDKEGRLSAFLIDRAYTEASFEIDIKTKRKDYQQTLYLRPDFSKAEESAAPEEEIRTLKELILELQALREEDYTKASLGEARKAAQEAAAVYRETAPERDAVREQIESLRRAKEGLVFLKELREALSEAKNLTPTEALSAAIAKAEQLLLKEDATKEEVRAALSALHFASGGAGGISQLSDGYYFLPLRIFSNGAVSEKWKEVFRRAELSVSGDSAVLILCLRKNTLRSLDFALSGKDFENMEILGRDGDSPERVRIRFLRSESEGHKLLLRLHQDQDQGEENVELQLDYASSQSTADPAELYQELLRARAYLSDGERYTEETRGRLLQEISRTEEALYGSALSEERISGLLRELRASEAGLKKAADRSALEGKIGEAGALSERRELYTEESYALLAEALSAARRVYADPNASQEALDTELRALEAAIDGLELRSRRELRSEIEAAERYREGEYSAESWKAFSEVLSRARECFSDRKRSDADYRKALSELRQAEEALRKLPEESEARQALEEAIRLLQKEAGDGSRYEETSFRSFSGSLHAGQDLLDHAADYGAGDAQYEAAKRALAAEYDALLLPDGMAAGSSGLSVFASEGFSYGMEEEDAGYAGEPSFGRDSAIAAEIATSSELPDFGEGELPQWALEGALDSSGNLTDSFGESYPDGVYSVNCSLWQFSQNKASMGDGALVDAFPDRPGKQAKLLLEGGRAYLYAGFQRMEFSGLSGHLLDIVMLDGLKKTNGVIDEGSYTEVPPEILEESEETDRFGPPAGRKYPSLVRFDITKYMAARNQYIPVMVNVPVMGASARQPAYLRCYWSSLTLVEGKEPEKPDEPKKPEQPGADFTGLETVLNQVSAARESEYTEGSYNALSLSVAAGERLKALKGAPQNSVDRRIEALRASYAALILKKRAEPDRPESPDQPKSPDRPDQPNRPDQKSDPSALRSRLQLKYMEGIKALQGNYTEASLSALEEAMKAAVSVLNDKEATKLQLERAVQKLENALSGLVLKEEKPSGTVNRKALSALIAMASAMDSSAYTKESWTKLMAALSLARNVYSDEKATQAELDSQEAALRLAIESLSPAGNPGDSGDGGAKRKKSEEKEGYYKVGVRLWHASMNKASMGDPAVGSTAYVKIENGDVTMRLITKEMKTSGITAHLHHFWIYRDSEYNEAELIYEEKNRWIYEFSLPNDSSSYYKCEVDPQVEVMGTDPVKARLKVNWSGKKKISESKWEDLGGYSAESGSKEKAKLGSTSSGSSSSELRNAETGISLRGATGGPENKLEAEKKESGEEFERAKSALSDKASRFVLYDIRLKSGERELQPSGTVTLRLPIPADYDPSRLALYRINDDGTALQLPGSVSGSFYEVSLDHLSLYALAEKLPAPSDSAAPGERALSRAGNGGGSGTVQRSAASVLRSGAARSASSGGGAVNGRSIPYTGDRMPLRGILALGLFGLLLFIGGAADERRRRNRRRLLGGVSSEGEGRIS